MINQRNMVRILVLVLIGGLLFVGMFKGNWPIGDIERKARRTVAANETVNLVNALKQFLVDNRRFPAFVDDRRDVSIRSDQPLMRILMAEGSSEENPKQLIYFDGKAAENGRNGLIHTNGGPVLVDPWGNPYELVLDTSGDGQVTTPDGSVVKMNVICYSLGPDGIVSEDDLKSW